MADMSVAVVGDQLREIGFAEPARHHRFQHATRAALQFQIEGRVGIRRARALAGDHEHQPRAASARAAQEGQQGAVRGGLGHAMQVDARVGIERSPAQALRRVAVEAARRFLRHRGNGFWRRFDGAFHRLVRARFPERFRELLALLVGGLAFSHWTGFGSRT